MTLKWKPCHVPSHAVGNSTPLSVLLLPNTVTPARGGWRLLLPSLLLQFSEISLSIYSGPGPALDWEFKNEEDLVLILGIRCHGSWHSHHSFVSLLPCLITLWKLECFGLYWYLGTFEGVYMAKKLRILHSVFHRGNKLRMQVRKVKKGLEWSK